MTRHFDYCPSASEGDNQSVRSSAPVVSRCLPGGYNVKLYISRGRLAWWLVAFLHSETVCCIHLQRLQCRYAQLTLVKRCPILLSTPAFSLHLLKCTEFKVYISNYLAMSEYGV